MSKVVKGIGKIFKPVTKLVKKTARFVAKHGKYIAMGAALYFTAGAAMAMFPATSGFAAAMPGISGFTQMLGITANAAAGVGAGASVGAGVGAGASVGGSIAAGAAAGGSVAAGTSVAAGAVTAMTAFQKAQVGLALLGTSLQTVGALAAPSEKSLISHRIDAQFKNQGESVVAGVGVPQTPNVGAPASTKPPSPTEFGVLPPRPAGSQGMSLTGSPVAAAPQASDEASRLSLTSPGRIAGLLDEMESGAQEARTLASPDEETQRERQSLFAPYNKGFV